MMVGIIYKRCTKSGSGYLIGTYVINVGRLRRSRVVLHTYTVYYTGNTDAKAEAGDHPVMRIRLWKFYKHGINAGRSNDGGIIGGDSWSNSVRALSKIFLVAKQLYEQ